MDLRRRTAVTIANSVFIGYPRGLRFNQQSVFDNYAAGTGKLLNNIMVAPTTTYSVGSGMTATAGDIETWFLATNTTITGAIEDQFAVLGLNNNVAFGNNVTSGYSANPSFAVTTGTLASGASFTDEKLNTWFTPTTYRGAFGATDWTDGWAEFLPNAQAY
jgi:hypothetical protein